MVILGKWPSSWNDYLFPVGNSTNEFWKQYVSVFPGGEWVVNCQSVLPKRSKNYNSHLLKAVKLTIMTCLKLVKGHKETFFHLSEVTKSD